MTPPWYNFHMSHCPHGFSFSHMFFLSSRSPFPIFELPPSEDHVNQKSEKFSDKNLLYCFTTKKTIHKTLRKLTKTPLNMDLPKKEAGLSSDAWNFHNFWGCYDCYVNSRGGTHMMLHFKDIQKLHGSLTVCPFRKYNPKRKADRLQKPILFRGENDKNFWGWNLRPRISAGIVCFNQATPWHHDNVADFWNAIPLTSVVQSHSAHLATGAVMSCDTAGTWDILHWKRRHMKEKQTFLGVPKWYIPGVYLAIVRIADYPKTIRNRMTCCS